MVMIGGKRGRKGKAKNIYMRTVPWQRNAAIGEVFSLGIDDILD